MPDESELHIQRRNLPHWRMDCSVYFITFRAISGTLNESERQIVFDHITQGHDRFYILFAVVVMPDHIHMPLMPMHGVELSRIMKGIKGVSANTINKSRNQRGHVWQDESWDRIVRNAAEFDEKMEYMIRNPVKAGLVADPSDYLWLHVNHID